MLRIWGRSNSNNVKKVLWCAAEAGVPYERIDVGGAYGRLNSPEFAALNPNQQIPVIEDGDLVLWESNAIVRYLAARYAPGTLYADDPARRALAPASASCRPSSPSIRAWCARRLPSGTCPPSRPPSPAPPVS